jgi:hypothetical protein
MAQQQLFRDETYSKIIGGDALQSQTTEDFYQQMGQSYYIVKDEEIQQQLREDSDLKVLMPELSHLSRTSNVTSKDAIEEMKVNWRMACRLQIMVKKTPNLQSQAKFLSWLDFGYTAIYDREYGWRGKLLTERIKTYKIENSPQRGGSFLSRWFGR